MPNVVASLFHDLTSPDTNPPAWTLSGHNWVTLSMLLLVPLSFLRKLDSLRHTSYIAMFSVGELRHWFLSIDRCRLKYIFDSIPGDYCHHVLLQTSGWCPTSRRSPFDPFHTQLCDHVPCASVCVHVRTECKMLSLILARC